MNVCVCVRICFRLFTHHQWKLNIEKKRSLYDIDIIARTNIVKCFFTLQYAEGRGSGRKKKSSSNVFRAMQKHGNSFFGLYLIQDDIVTDSLYQNTTEMIWNGIGIEKACESNAN